MISCSVHPDSLGLHWLDDADHGSHLVDASQNYPILWVGCFTIISRSTNVPRYHDMSSKHGLSNIGYCFFICFGSLMQQGSTTVPAADSGWKISVHDLLHMSFTFYFQTNPDWLLVAVCDCDGDHLLRKPRCFPDLPHHRVPHLRPQHPRGEGWWWRKIFPPILGLLGGEQGGHLGSPWWICHWKLLWGCRGREIQVHFRNSPVLKTVFFITLSMRFCSGTLRSRLWSTKRRTPFQAGRWPKIFCHCQLQVNLPHDQEQRACVHWVEVQVGAGHEGAIQHHQTVWLCLRLVPHILH